MSLSDLPWAKGSMTAAEQEALANLQRIERVHNDVAQVILRFPWVADNITDDERVALSYLTRLAQRFSLFSSSLGELHEVLSDTDWLIDGITQKETLFLRDLVAIKESDTTIAVLLANSYTHSLDDYTPSAATPAPTSTPAPPSSASEYAWARDGLTAIEQEALGYLQKLQDDDQLVFDALSSNHRWLADGIVEDERRFLCYILTIPEQGTRLAIVLSEVPASSTPACGSPSAAEPAPTRDPSAEPSFSISPRGGRPGETVTISGVGFPRFAVITSIEVYGNSLVPPSSLQTGSDGSFSVNVAVPDLPPGTHNVRVTVEGLTVAMFFQAIR